MDTEENIKDVAKVAAKTYAENNLPWCDGDCTPWCQLEDLRCEIGIGIITKFGKEAFMAGVDFALEKMKP